MLNPSYPLLGSIATLFPFETAVGTNALLWIRASTVRQTIALGRAIRLVDEGECEVGDVLDLVGKWELDEQE